MKIDIQAVLAVIGVLSGFGMLFGYINTQDQRLTVLEGESITIGERMIFNSEMAVLSYRVGLIERPKKK
jgi:hypothetical protein